MPVIIALEKLHKIRETLERTNSYTRTFHSEKSATRLSDPPQPLYRCLTESRPSDGLPGSNPHA
jgi:hypothetical protein